MTNVNLSRSSHGRSLQSIFFIVAILASACYSALAQTTLTWDPDASPATGSQDNGTWSPSGTGVANWSDGSTDQTWLDGETASFGPTGASGSATVSVSGTVSPAEINFNATGYTLTDGYILFENGSGGTTLNLGVSGLNEEIDSNIGIASGGGDATGTVVTGCTLTLTGGIDNSLNNQGKALSFGGGGTVILTSPPGNNTPFSTSYNVGSALFAGSGSIIQEGNTILDNGASSNGSINADLGQGDSVPTGPGTYTVNSAGALFNAYNVYVGQGNAYTLDVENGVAEVGNTLNIGTSTNTGNTAPITDEVKVGGAGKLASNAAINILSDNGTAQNAVLEIDGGVTVANKGIVVGGSDGAAGSTATLNVTGGKLFVGTAGITTGGGAAATAVNLSGGTIGATGDWNSSLGFNLTNTTTFQTSDAGATINAGPTNIYTYNGNGTPYTITLNGNLSGNGGLFVTGPGQLALGGSDTYSGNTEVASGADLDLTSNFSLALNSTLIVDDSSTSRVDLNFAGSDTIEGLTIDGTALASGTYDASDVSSGVFDGGGSLIVTPNVVPEPNAWVMTISGLMFLAGSRHIRSRRY